MDVIMKKKENALNCQPWPKTADWQCDPSIDGWVFAFRVMWYCAKTKSIKNAKFRSTSASNDYNVWVTDWIEWCDIFFFKYKIVTRCHLITSSNKSAHVFFSPKNRFSWFLNSMKYIDSLQYNTFCVYLIGYHKGWEGYIW